MFGRTWKPHRCRAYVDYDCSSPDLNTCPMCKVENRKINANRITFILLTDHFPYDHTFLQIPVDQLKSFSRKRDKVGKEYVHVLKGNLKIFVVASGYDEERYVSI